MKKFPFFALFVITLSCLLFALTVNVFLVTNQMGQGGVTGLALMIFYTLNIPMEWSFFIINGILLLIGYRYLDKKTIAYTIYSTIMFSIFVRITNGLHYTFEDTMLIPIFVGILIGMSIGFIMLVGGSTAGVDIIALILKRYFHIPTSVSLFFLDLIIIVPSAFIIGFERMIYTLIMLAVTTKTVDFILEGLNVKKSVMIISNHHQYIADVITTELERGVTVIHGHGHYTKEDKRILYVIVNRQQVVAITRLVNKIDPTAFMTISNVHSVAGEGFSYNVRKKKKNHNV